MATFSLKGRIDAACVKAEVARLQQLWSTGQAVEDGLDAVMPPDCIAALDPFDHVQLSHVVEICRRSWSLSEAS
jgi:transcriptional regulatory protein RtcR